MPIRVLGVLVVSSAIAMAVIACMAWFELRSLSTSTRAPTADDMKLTRLLCPELFAPAEPGARPIDGAELASLAFRRIVMIGTGSFVLIIAGLVALLLPLGSRPVATSPQLPPTDS